MKGGTRVGGTVWIDRCDNCSREITVGHRWRKRHLCDDCAEVAVKQDIARSSMMLGNSAAGRKREADRRRKEHAAARQRDRRARQKQATAPKPDDAATRKLRAVVERMAGDHGPDRGPADPEEAGCPDPKCGRYSGHHA